jgi:hypothetical protein
MGDVECVGAAGLWLGAEGMAGRGGGAAGRGGGGAAGLGAGGAAGLGAAGAAAFGLAALRAFGFAFLAAFLATTRFFLRAGAVFLAFLAFLAFDFLVFDFAFFAMIVLPIVATRIPVTGSFRRPASRLASRTWPHETGLMKLAS